VLETGLYTLLSTNAGVSALVGTRIYPVQGPPDAPTYPYITYQPVTGGSEYALNSAEARRKRIQFDCWAASALANLQILTALRNVLTGYTGTLTDGTRVLFTTRENEMANFDDSQKVYRSVCEYEFLFVEP
jgi:hypothetical protein